jgi:branched-chain amino acid transport system substrate-binding protein
VPLILSVACYFPTGCSMYPMNLQTSGNSVIPARPARPCAARGLVFSLLVLLLASPPVFARKTNGVEPVITLGALITRDPAGDPDTQAAIRFALKDVNAFFASLGEGPKASFLLNTRGTGLDAEVARQKIEVLAARRLKVIIGPESSAEVAAIKSFADDHGMVLISHCSTAPSLAIADDSIYRLVPSDLRQAQAIAQLIRDTGHTALIPVWREGVWGDDISSATLAQFTASGGVVYPGVRFNPEATDYAADLVELNAQLNDARAHFGGEVAVGFFSFGQEGARMLSQAAAFPALAEVSWFGSDGTALSREILNDAQAARFAESTGFYNTLFTDSRNPRADALRARISTAIGGGGVHFCSMAAYDAVWLAALAAAIAGVDDIEAFKTALEQVAGEFEGVTGSTRLDEAGDRADAAYDVWAIQAVNGQWAWVLLSSASSPTTSNPDAL